MFSAIDVTGVSVGIFSNGSCILKAAFSKKYLSVIKKLAKEANEFTIACDYDSEGEVIGLNVIRYACKKKDANRMKFSTLTKPDLIESYENKSKHLDWAQSNAGDTRHFLDFYNGINLAHLHALLINNKFINVQYENFKLNFLDLNAKTEWLKNKLQLVILIKSLWPENKRWPSFITKRFSHRDDLSELGLSNLWSQNSNEILSRSESLSEENKFILVIVDQLLQ